MYTLTQKQVFEATILRNNALARFRPYTDLRAIVVHKPVYSMEVYPEHGGRTRDGLHAMTVERKTAYYTVTMRVRDIGSIGCFWTCTDHVPGDNEDDAVEGFMIRHRNVYEFGGRCKVVLQRLNVSNTLTIKV